MEKRIFIFFFLTSFLSFAQKTTVKGYVYYGEYENIFQGIKGGREIRGNLIFDANDSYYYTGKDSLNNEFEMEYKMMYPASTANTDIGGTIYSGDISSARDHLNYRIHTTKDTISDYFERYSPKNGDFHYLKELNPKFDWVLINETKKIGAFNCLKATCHFRGRDYIAWYTLEIPVSYGPWKFQGLPGLILEVYTPNQEIYFSAKKILYPFNFSKPIPKINKPKDVKWMTSVKELLKRQDETLEEAHELGTLHLASMPNLKGKIILEKSINRYKEFEE
jgi:GLPGLI family protein